MLDNPSAYKFSESPEGVSVEDIKPLENSTIFTDKHSEIVPSIWSRSP
jgi:hypothetical protein